MKYIFLFLFTTCLVGVRGKDDVPFEWNYSELGPDHWNNNVKTCAGEEQSPIDIIASSARYDRTLEPIHLIRYEEVHNWNVTHTGQTINLYPSDGELQINGSNFGEPFTLAQFHFHWGENIYQGSEHFINGEKFPLEVHFVHGSQSKKYAVLGFLFQLSEKNNTALDPLLAAIRETTKTHETATVALNLSTILPGDEFLTDYFRYFGSLTTPPCTEGIKWTVIKHKINISEHQLTSFRDNSVKKNFREPQKNFQQKNLHKCVECRHECFTQVKF